MTKESADCILLLKELLIVTLFESLHHMSRDSSVGISLGYGLDERGSWVRFPAGLGIFLFTPRPEQL
jgi:hypothetical protein